MLNKKIRNGFAAALLAMTTAAPAEDIDLFMGVAPPTSAELPNVLVFIDNTANWEQAFTAEMAALKASLEALEAGKFRVGFMFYTETGGANNNVDGAYVRAAVRSMTADYKSKYMNLVMSFDKRDDKASGGKLGLAMSEVNRYYAGMTAYAGTGKIKRDYTGNVISGLTYSNAVYALPGNALSSAAATVYNSPAASTCQKNFLIFLSNGKSNSNTSDEKTAKDHLAAVGGSTATIPLTPSGMQSEIADEWARYLASKTSAPVYTYVIDVVPTVPGQYSTDYRALLESIASQGKGKYFNVGSAGASDVGDKIADAFDYIFGEIQAVNGVFASASLPVSVNTQGTYLNQMFVGMFRPDETAAPRWAGNLKQYKFKATVEGSGYALDLVDADDALAINKSTGFITQCARSFWTPTEADEYWSFKAQGSCPDDPDGVSNTPDGDIVEKGGAGYVLRAKAPTARIVKTCTACGDGSDLESFSTSTATAALLGVSATEQPNLVNWIRGTDVQDENGNGNSTEMRPSVHADVVHSRPVAVDYGADTGVVVFYGANDGMLRAVSGNQAGTGAGGELWSFVAPEHYGRFKRIYDNAPKIVFPSDGGSDGKPYFFDGPVSAYQSDSDVWIYASQRRGGRMIYAFDVSDPAAPSLKWRRGCTTGLGDDSGCQSGFEGMGQTWPAPKAFKAAGYTVGSENLPLLIVGGGYDTCEDTDDGTTNNTCTAPKGNKVYVLDADEGTLLKTFTTLRSVVGDVTVVPNSSGLADYAYVADTGGNVYRIKIGTAAPDDWQMTRIASLGCDAAPCTVGGVTNRKFLFGPEVVVTPYYNAVLLGSGDREHPLQTHTVTTTVQNGFFMLKDKPDDEAWFDEEAAHCGGQSLLCVNSLTAFGNTETPPATAAFDETKGWYLKLSSSEQVVTSAVVLYGTVTFSTHMPTTPDLCGANLGTARVYNVSYLTATAASGDVPFEKVAGGGLPPSPVSGMVTVSNPTTGEPMTVPFIMGSSPDSPLEVDLKTGGAGAAGNKERVYWYIEQ